MTTFAQVSFGVIARRVLAAIFIELPLGRRREAGSLAESADFQPGDRIKTLRGSTLGVIVRLQPDGQVVGRPDRSSAELIALPESLLRESG